MTKLKDISCPRCGKKDTWSTENKFRPFCSERCKMIDLGAWAAEEYNVPGEPVDPNPDSGEDSED